METIQGFQADQSAGTRLAVWAWTWDYAKAHPFGGGFGAYRSNRIQVQTMNAQTTGEVQLVTARVEADEARAYHSSYFEMLGEQGFPGLILFLLIHVHRALPHGGVAAALPQGPGRYRLDRAARDRVAEFPAHLSGRLAIRRHRLSALRAGW